MTEAEQLLIAAADFNSRVRACESAGRPVEMQPGVVRTLACFLETCGRITAKAGRIEDTKTPALIEHAHDIARTHLGEFS